LVSKLADPQLSLGRDVPGLSWVPQTPYLRLGVLGMNEACLFWSFRYERSDGLNVRPEGFF